MRSPQYWLDILAVICLLYAPIFILNPYWLNLNRLPTGGDTASHVFYAYQFCQYFPGAGLTQWLPEVFGGFPFLSYYFPLPFILIFLLKQLLPFAVAFKWGVFLAGVATPTIVFVLSVFWLRLSRYAGILAGCATLAFLLHEHNSIWGGNLLSILAGEFAYSYGMLFSLLTVSVWIKAFRGEYFWLLAGILEAATGFSHGYALLVTGFSSFFILLNGNFKWSLLFLTLSHSLAFFLLAGWLWPLLAMHGTTIPNDSVFMWSSWREFLPVTLAPVLMGGLIGIVLLLRSNIRQIWRLPSQSAIAFMIAAMALSFTLWCLADRLGLADIRFFPYVWLFGAITCAWLLGEALNCFGQRYRPIINAIVVMLSLSLLTWTVVQAKQASDWSAWNHSGHENKTPWQQLSKLFPLLQGKLDSPRLLFEHSPLNNDLGSTRSLEALPLFLKHRPVLEGLYMESAILSPVIYQLQSEVSQAPSSPLIRFPSGSLSISVAAQHMQLLHANEILARSEQSKTAIEQSGLFSKIGESTPFALYRLNTFNSQLIETPAYPLQAINDKDWMEHAFAWFKRYPQVDYWPIYLPFDQKLNLSSQKPAQSAHTQLIEFKNNRIVFNTDQLGQPHLLKMSFHPRWQLTGEGDIYLAAPGFMMIIPKTNPVELVYDATWVNRCGQWASLLAGGVLLVHLALRRFRLPDVEVVPCFRIKPALGGWLSLLVTLNALTYYTNPERLYNSAWQNMHHEAYEQAAVDFDAIEGRRRNKSSQEEALFWAAKAHELAGHRDKAKQHYQQLIEHYSGYWLPESLYTLARLHRLDGRPDFALPLEKRLRQDYPQHQFTQQLDHP